MTEPDRGEETQSPADPARPGAEGEALPPLPEPLPYVVGTPPGLPPLEGFPAFDLNGDEIPTDPEGDQ
ncbi:hypothetical protein GCM10027597_01220 [Saccharopolyspora tripterygii]